MINIMVSDRVFIKIRFWIGVRVMVKILFIVRFKIMVINMVRFLKILGLGLT